MYPLAFKPMYPNLLLLCSNKKSRYKMAVPVLRASGCYYERGGSVVPLQPLLLRLLHRQVIRWCQSKLL